MLKIVANNNDFNVNCQEDIIFLFKIIDIKANDIINNIQMSIHDFKSAKFAEKYYDKNWFVDQLLSNEAKVKIATLLKDICNRYNVESIIWDLIAEKSTMIIEQIDILTNKDKFLNNFEG